MHRWKTGGKLHMHREGRGTSLQNLLLVEDSGPGGYGQELSYPPQESEDMGWEGEAKEDFAVLL